MTIEAFIESAWNDHGDRPEEVAERLAQSVGLIELPSDIAPFARLVTHVYGEHLGRWGAGITVLESLRGLPCWDGSPAAAGAVTRSIAVLRFAAGDNGAVDNLPAEDRITALATVSSAFAGMKEFKRAIATYEQARSLAAAGLPPGSPALRALAVGGNNLAAALEEKSDRDAAETQGMVAAAAGGLEYWKLAGTWLEEERALYRLARSHLQAGDHGEAIRSAQRCIDICATNGAPAIEAFFGHAVLALAQRAAGDGEAFVATRSEAMRLLDRVAPEERSWCESELAELAGEP